MIEKPHSKKILMRLKVRDLAKFAKYSLCKKSSSLTETRLLLNLNGEIFNFKQKGFPQNLPLYGMTTATVALQKQDLHDTARWYLANTLHHAWGSLTATGMAS